MDTFFILIFFASFFALIIGLVRPKVFAPLFRGKTTRKGVLYVFGGLFLVSIVVVGAISPTAQEPQPERAIPQELPQTQSLDQNLVAGDAIEGENAPVAQENKQPDVQPAVLPLPPSSPPPSPPPPEQEAPSALYSVVKVIDGDTVTLSMNGKNETLRLIGMDTPETVDPRKPVQCFGIEASNKAKELLSGKRVRAEAETTQGERDKYDRLLRYIFLEDGRNYQDYMIRQGYAHEYTYNLPYKYQSQFKQAEGEARVNKRGLWADGVCEEEEPEQISTPEPESEPEAIPEPIVIDGQTFECSKDTYNCGDFKTHDEAQSVFEYCGGINNDIHRLDGNKDGQACESLP